MPILEREPLLEISGLHAGYGKVQVLHGVSFSVEKGQVMALIGASGSGKSTALRCIDRLEVIDSGHIEVCGHRAQEILGRGRVRGAAVRRNDDD